MAWGINAIVKRPNVINIIVNAIEKKDIVLIAIAKGAKIKSLNIAQAINIQQKKKKSPRKILLYPAPVQKVAAIKTIVNAIKIKLSVIAYVDAEIAKIVKMEKNQKIKKNQNMSVPWLIVFLLLIIK
jgi:hypothetical protein